METNIIGYIATSTSILGFGSQVFHTIQTKTTAGMSPYRTVFDTLSLALWVYYAAKVNDNPLLIAVTFECVLSGVILVFLVKHRTKRIAVKDYTPPPSPPSDPGSMCIEVRVDRRNSI
jgi:MtN3 and saliva related transmembrane protein